jgi:hypothetical protein
VLGNHDWHADRTDELVGVVGSGRDPGARPRLGGVQGRRPAVDVLRAQGAPPPPDAVGEQLVRARAPATQSRYDVDRRLIGDSVHAPNPALGGIVEHDRAVADRDVLPAERREAKAAAIIGVLLTADPEHP